MSICILNKDSNTCLPVPIINIIQKDVLQTNHKSKEEAIINLAKKTNCPITDNLQTTELCILQKLKKNVNNEYKQQIINKALITYFKPITKSYDPNHWLNNTEIDHIQHQFMTQFKGYYYSNIHMIDLVMFNPTHSDIIHYDIKPIIDINFVNELKKENNFLNYNGDLKNFGIVINTDYSSGGGIHWFSIFMNFASTPYEIEYFNSSGFDIKNKDFKYYFKNLADEISRDVGKCKFVQVTDIQHQRSDTSNCGSYSLYYIWSRLNGTPYSYFAENKITDEDMEKFRSFLYRLK